MSLSSLLTPGSLAGIAPEKKGDPEYPQPWATKQPREALRDTEEARVVSLLPDVCLTPRGNVMVPVPYNIHDLVGHDTNFANSVRFTRQRAMIFRSKTQHVHGNEQGAGGGVKSGTTPGQCEPIDHASQLRAEGSWVIRHQDKFWMNNRNTIGEARFVRDMQEYKEPQDTDPVPGSAEFMGPSAPPKGAPQMGSDMGDDPQAQMQQQSVGTLGGTGAVPANPTAPAGSPSIPKGLGKGLLRRTGIWGLVIEQIANDLSMSPEERAIQGRAASVLNSPMAEQIIREDQLLGGRSTGSMFDSRYWNFSGKYGTFIDADERVPLANDILSAATGKPMDVRTMTDAELQQALQSVAKQRADSAAQSEAGSRVSGTTKKICFQVPEGGDEEEFRKQLKEQEEELKKLSPEEYLKRRADFKNFGRPSDGADRKAAREEYRVRREQEVRERLARDNPNMSRGDIASAAASEVAKDMAGKAATHALDWIAGGDGRISGLGGASENSSIGSQWRNGRADQLDKIAEEQKKQGKKTLDVDLDIC
ncbi:MAG: polymorphic toxin type 15 domain-containing protein [Beijerinckiaceae bacterium]